MPAERYDISDLLRVMQRLRDPQYGCPWDLAQDFDTIVPSTLEEAYELVEAIEQEDYEHVAEEMGDLLFQVIFYAQLGSERALFDFSGIVHTLVEKLVRRHPHVFADGEIEGLVEDRGSVAGVKQNWEAIKREERAAREQHSLLDDVPVAQPAISRAQKLQKRAAMVGFDWPGLNGVMEKLQEEIAEFEQARRESARRREEEFGDILFSCINLARHADIDAEAALRRANSRFEQRFKTVEALADEAGERLADCTPEQLDQFWEKAKGSA